MREIKCRVWDKNEKTFIYFNPIQGLLNECDRQYIHNYVDLKTIGLYTGLQDKNGVEIYEGDIVIGTTDNPGGPSDVFYGYGVYQPFSYLGVYDGTKYEVIGNIHENPELIK